MRSIVPPMPRHEPLGRPAPGEVIGETKVKLRRDKDGKLVGIVPDQQPKATTEARPDPKDPPPVPQPPRYAT